VLPTSATIAAFAIAFSLRKLAKGALRSEFKGSASASILGDFG